ncbi:hypothetical protein JCM5805K_1071 [Lactococcus lactis subsp. lactis]|uniref:Uncharacterized protein n=1 Tax=Lactococcus lactis subsp. lactis TaxID=1360 RepID=A0A0B8QYJ1_LACLL|nr:hypothetical protein JCM5805K_1071 [Lactococcus lactis subsp. lactis]
MLELGELYPFDFDVFITLCSVDADRGIAVVLS